MNYTAISLMLAALLILGACATGKTTQDNSPIRIGWIGPLTGTASTYGTVEYNAAVMAVEDINAQGGINGRNVTLVIEDGKCDGMTSSTAATKLIEVDGLKQILGGHCSTESLSIVPITDPKKVFLMAGATGTDKYSGAGNYSFRTCPPAGEVYASLGRYAYSKGIRKAAILAEERDWSKSVQAGFSKGFKSLGGEITTVESFAPGTTDFRTALMKIAQTNPQIIMISGQGSDTDAEMIKQIKELKLDVQIYGDQIAITEEVYKKSHGAMPSDATGGIMYVRPDSSPQTKEFLDRYVARFGSLPTGTFHPSESYSQVKVLAELIKKCGDDSDCERKEITSHEWDTVLGKITFNEKGDVQNVPVTIVRIVDGKSVYEDMSQTEQAIPASVKHKVGVIAPLTGIQAEYGVAFVNGLKMAQEELKCGDNIEFVYEDSAYNPKTAITAFQRLVDIEHTTLVVNWGNLPSEAIAPLTKEMGFPFIAGATALPKEDYNRYTLRTLGDPSKIAQALMDHFRENNLTKIGIIQVQNPYLESLISGLKNAKNANEEIRIMDTPGADDMDFKQSILKIKESDIQTIGVFLFPGQIRQFYKQASNLGLKIPTFGSDMFESQTEIDGADGKMEGAVYPYFGSDPSFAKRYASEFGNANQLVTAVGSYDLCGLVATKIDFTNKDTIADSFERIKDYNGVEGRFSFANKEGDRFLDIPIRLKGIANNTIVTLK